MITPAIEILGSPGVFRTLQSVGERPDYYSARDIEGLLATYGASGTTEEFSKLANAGFFLEASATGRFSLTTMGKKLLLLTDAINGRDLSEVIQDLSSLFPGVRPYELLTRNITHRFIHDLYARPDFGRVYICSPWISLSVRQQRWLLQAFYETQKAGIPRVEILVITRPIRKINEQTRSLKKSLEWLKKNGAEIVYNDRVHAKLFIREPGLRGGQLVAVFGSENLTKSRYIELGIQINNDSYLVNNLIRYYYEIYQQSQVEAS
jgi:hypothetical protein